jgi:hypothetical protein
MNRPASAGPAARPAARPASLSALSLLLLLGGCIVGGGDQDWAFDAADVTEVSVELSSGDVHIEPGDGEEIEVSWSGGGVSLDAMPTVEVIDGLLVVDADCGLACGGDLRVTLPAGVPTFARLERGDLHIEQDEGVDIDACVGAGDLHIYVPEGGYCLDLDAGAGSVDMDGIWQDEQAKGFISACVGAGDLQVEGR